GKHNRQNISLSKTRDLTQRAIKQTPLNPNHEIFTSTRAASKSNQIKSMAAKEEEQESSDQVVEEEFSVWKKNTPVLYDLVISHPLEWPSLTAHWVPLAAPLPYAADPTSFNVHKLVLGTHTSDEFPNYLLIADAVLPTRNAEVIISGDSENSVIPKVEISQKIRVNGEVNRARCMPQNPSVIGAKTSESEVYIFDSTNQAQQKADVCDPDLRLRGHDKEGYGLSWSHIKRGYLVSGSNDCKICLWDIGAVAQNKVLDALHVYEGHQSVVEDVDWHLKNENLFGSVGDDCQLMIWDLRTNQTQISVKAHEKEINYLSFNPFNENILATASSDSTIGLFDLRKMEIPLHVLSGHTEEVFQVEWNPNQETVLASSADDRRLNVWDLNRYFQNEYQYPVRSSTMRLN
ncbi:WD-40 repeat-containing protein MSI3, partial [Linum perenne]